MPVPFLVSKPALLLQILKGSGPVLEKLAPVLEKVLPKLGPIGDAAAVGFYVLEVHQKGVKQGTIDFVKAATSYDDIKAVVHKVEEAKEQLDHPSQPSEDVAQPDKK